MVWGMRGGGNLGARPSEALSIPPAYGMADVSGGIHDNTAAFQGHTTATWPSRVAVCVCVSIKAHISW